MDHDSVPLELAGPASHRIADVSASYTKIIRHGLDVMAHEVESSPEFASNRDGHFAWDVSLLVRAACLAWRATKDPAHLHHAITWAKHMMDRTDEATGQVDWRGQSGPVWSSGPRYTAGSVDVGSIGGAPVRLQAAADHVVIERPTDTTAVVRAFRDGGRSWSSTEASLLRGDESYLPDLLARRSASFSVLLRGLPGAVDLTWLPAGEHAIRPDSAPHLVHTGLIARSLIAAADAIDSAGDAVERADVTADDLYAAAERALLAHDGDIRIRRGRAWYVTPEDFPGRRLGLDLPHNHVVDAATSFLLIGRRRQDGDLSALGVSLTRRFLHELDDYAEGELRHPWYYYPVDSEIFAGVSRAAPMDERVIPAVPRGEDSSHATMRVRALAEWRAINDSLVPDSALESTALAFRRFFMSSSKGIATLRWLPDDAADAPRRGSSDTFAGAWGALAPWDSSLKRRINSMAYRHPPTAIFGATMLSAAEIVAMNADVATYASSDRTSRG